MNNTNIQIKLAQDMLKDLLEGATDKAFIDKVAGISAQLDVASAEGDKAFQQYEEMKDDYIKIVKDVKFTKAPEDIIPQEQHEKTFEECLAEVLQKGK